MGRILINDHCVNAHFDNNSEKQPSIAFSDPSYVRAEAILFDPNSRNVHAVMHEGLHLIGRAPEEVVEKFKKSDVVKLHADHYTAGALSLYAPISLIGR